MLSPAATISNSRIQASEVAVPAGKNGAIAGSPAVPLLKLTSAPSGPAHAAECPLVRTTPFVIARGVPTEVNVPLATPGQVSVGAEMVTPGPARVAAKVAAVAPEVTTN